MSKLDSTWSSDNVRAAAADGWLLAYTVDSGKTMAHASLELFPVGPKFDDRIKLAKHVVQRSRQGSRLHLAAMSAILASRTHVRRGK